MNALRDTNPIDDRAVEALRLDGLEDDLLAAIVATPAELAPRRSRRRLFAVGVVAVAAGCAALAVGLAGGGGSPTEQAWAAPALRVANSVPRLLLPGWQVERADEFTVGEGEMTFRRGERSLDLSWSRLRAVSDDERVRKFEDPASGYRKLPETEVVGTKATVFSYPGQDFTALWMSEGYVLELRGALPRDEFTAALRSLRPAGVDAWLSAMPASVVKPVDTRVVVDEMLRDMPLPPGLDRDEIAADDAVRDRYQLGARVAGAVACGWLDRWASAKRAGDDVAVAAAVKALRTSRDWAIVNEMNRDGDYPEVLWQYADAVAGGGTVMGGKPLTVEQSYKQALGCS